MNNNNNNNDNNKAFSLIELSIVLIIIGLLVASITGGQSLIENAKIKRFSNELFGWKQAVNAFYSLNGRLPGDFDNDDRIGWGAKDNYNKNSFSFPYDGTDTANNHYIPSNMSAPYVDLYLAKITDFEPVGKCISSSINKTCTNGELPFFKSLPKVYSHFEAGTGSDVVGHWLYRLKFKDYIMVRNNLDNKKQHTKYFWNFDKKYDDGISASGNVRAICYNGYDYKETILRKQTCGLMAFGIWE